MKKLFATLLVLSLLSIPYLASASSKTPGDPCHPYSVGQVAE